MDYTVKIDIRFLKTNRKQQSVPVSDPIHKILDPNHTATKGSDSSPSEVRINRSNIEAAFDPPLKLNFAILILSPQISVIL